MGEVQRRSLSGGDKFLIALFVGLFLVCGGGVALFALATSATDTSAQQNSTPSRPAVAAPRTSPPIIPCQAAPQRIVEMINASFTNGQYLNHAQSVNGPQAMTYVGGNIFEPSGQKQSSQDTWVLFNGTVYALTTDARRHTTLPDGRDLEPHYFDWPQYDAAVGECVGDVERSENQGR